MEFSFLLHYLAYQAYVIVIKACLLFIGLMLCALAGGAQGIISGIVRAKPDKAPLPGVVVMVAGSTTRTSTDIDGTFNLYIPTDTARLVFRAIGFRSKYKCVRAGDTLLVLMPVDCIQDYFYRRYVGISVTSGFKYLPIGGKLTLFQPNLLYTHFMQPAARLELDYQTGGRNSYGAVTFGVDELITTCSGFNLDVAFDYQKLNLAALPFSFERRSAGINVAWQQLPPIWLAIGRASFQREGDSRAHAGIELGSQYSPVL